MIVAAAGLLLAVVMFVSAVAKLVDPAGTQLALSTYGVRRPGAARAAWSGLVAAELILAAGLAAGWRPFAWAAAALFAVFALGQAVALAAGRGGAPCACFGARGRLSARSVARAATLAAAALALALLERPPLSSEQWLALGLAGALAVLAVLSVVVLALAREVGALRMAATPQGALDVPHEGPELGARSALAGFFGSSLADGRLGLAVFSSEGCAMCRALKPVVAAFGRNPRVALREFDEVADASAWTIADVPGSPYAVALDADGTVLAKGTFNSGAQLESVLATAERRRAGRGRDPGSGRAATTAGLSG